jgi:hypothetical protein
VPYLKKGVFYGINIIEILNEILTTRLQYLCPKACNCIYAKKEQSDETNHLKSETKSTCVAVT